MTRTKKANKDSSSNGSASQQRAKKARTERSKYFWYSLLCETYTSRYSHTSMASFLRSEASGPDIDAKKSSMTSFASYLKNFRKNDLQPKKAKRVHCSKHKEVEEKLVHYIDLRAKLFKMDGKGLSWQIMQAKCAEWAKDENDAKHKDFKASPGFICNVLNRNDIVGINLHGEGNEMSDDERCELIGTFKDEFHQVIENHSVQPCCVYNADQTGLFYNKLPNRMYVKKTEECTHRGVKAMKDKARITLMVCTSASGAKVPLFVVDKSKNPMCFQKRKPPIEYTSQSNA